MYHISCSIWYTQKTLDLQPMNTIFLTFINDEMICISVFYTILLYAKKLTNYVDLLI